MNGRKAAIGIVLGLVVLTFFGVVARRDLILSLITLAIAIPVDRFVTRLRSSKKEEDREKATPIVEEEEEEDEEEEEEEGAGLGVFGGATAMRVTRDADGNVVIKNDDDKEQQQQQQAPSILTNLGKNKEEPKSDDNSNLALEKVSSSSSSSNDSAKKTTASGPTLNLPSGSRSIVTLAQMSDVFQHRLQVFWARDEADFHQAWKKLDENDRLSVLAMLIVNMARGSKQAGFSIPDDDYQYFVPEMTPEGVKRMALRPHLVEEFIKFATTADKANDVEYLRGRSQHLHGKTIKTGASLAHDITWRIEDEDGGEKALQIFGTVRRLLISEVLVMLMNLVLGREFDGKPTGRPPLGAPKKEQKK